jgi:hypothetical protein
VLDSIPAQPSISLPPFQTAGRRDQLPLLADYTCDEKIKERGKIYEYLGCQAVLSSMTDNVTNIHNHTHTNSPPHTHTNTTEADETSRVVLSTLVIRHH